MRKEFITKTCLCPYCGYAFDRASSATGGKRAPEEGDASVCIACGALSIFNADGTVRKASLAEFYGLPAEARMQITKFRLLRDAVVGDKIKNTEKPNA